MAVEQLFAEMGLVPSVSRVGPLTHFAADNIDIYVGDIFELTGSELGRSMRSTAGRRWWRSPPTCAIATPSIWPESPSRPSQLLIAYEYDQPLQKGPPFYVSGEEVRRLYGQSFDLALVASADIRCGLKGKCPAQEHVWVLKKA